MADYVKREFEKMGFPLSKPMLATICIIFGIVVIILPSLLVWIVGLFLLVQGVLLLMDLLEVGRTSASTITPTGTYCTHCGTKNIDEALYCKNCGEKLEQLRQTKSKSPSKRTNS